MQFKCYFFAKDTRFEMYGRSVVGYISSNECGTGPSRITDTTKQWRCVIMAYKALISAMVLCAWFRGTLLSMSVRRVPVISLTTEFKAKERWS